MFSYLKYIKNIDVQFQHFFCLKISHSWKKNQENIHTATLQQNLFHNTMCNYNTLIVKNILWNNLNSWWLNFCGIRG